MLAHGIQKKASQATATLPDAGLRTETVGGPSRDEKYEALAKEQLGVTFPAAGWTRPKRTPSSDPGLSNDEIVNQFTASPITGIDHGGNGLPKGEIGFAIDATDIRIRRLEGITSTDLDDVVRAYGRASTTKDIGTFLADLDDIKPGALAAMTLSNKRLDYPQFNERALDGAKFIEVSIFKGSFWQSFLNKAVFEKTRMFKADFSSASLAGAEAKHGCSFDKCNFRNADMRGFKIDPSNSRFRGCNVRGANLDGSGISDFIYQHKPDQILKYLRGMRWDDSTIFSSDPGKQAMIVEKLKECSRHLWMDLSGGPTSCKQFEALMAQSPLRFVKFKDGVRLVMDPNDDRARLAYRRSSGNTVEVLYAPFLDDDERVGTKKMRVDELYSRMRRATEGYQIKP